MAKNEYGEPWVVYGKTEICAWVDTPKARIIADTHLMGDEPTGDDIAEAARIAACGSACAGVSDSDLRPGLLAEALEALRWYAKALEHPRTYETLLILDRGDRALRVLEGAS